MFWFEAAGQNVGRIDIVTVSEGEDTPTWKLIGKVKFDFGE